MNGGPKAQNTLQQSSPTKEKDPEAYCESKQLTQTNAKIKNIWLISKQNYV